MYKIPPGGGGGSIASSRPTIFGAAYSACIACIMRKGVEKKGEREVKEKN